MIDDANKEEKCEVWYHDVVIEEIVQYYNKHKELGVILYKEGKINEGDVDEKSDDDKSCDVGVDA